MKKHKALLAKILAAAMVVSVAAPGGLTAEAAQIYSTTTQSSTETSEYWSNVWIDGVGYEEYWMLESSSESNDAGLLNVNSNSDYSAENAPAVLLYNEDVRNLLNDERTFSMQLYPNGTSSYMRFGFMVKFVDATHWAYVYYDPNGWGIEYNYENESGTSVNSYATLLGNLASLEDYANTTITIEYTYTDTYGNELTGEDAPEDATLSNNILITATDEDGNTLGTGYCGYDEDAGIDSSGGITAMAALDTMTVSEEATESETDDAAAASNDASDDSTSDAAYAPYYIGYKAATYDVYITNIHLRNITLGEESIMDTSKWAFFKDRSGQVFNTSAEAGGTDHAALGGFDTTDPTVAISTDVTDLENGTLTATITPQEYVEETEDETEAEAETETESAAEGEAAAAAEATSRDASADDAASADISFAIAAKYTAATEDAAESSVKVGYNGASWYYTIGQATTTVEGPAVSVGTAYTLYLSVDEDVLNADVTVDGTTTTLAADVDASGVSAGALAIEAGAGTKIYLSGINYSQTVYSDPDELQAAYNAVADITNDDNTYYTDVYSSFDEYRTTVATLLADDDAKITSTEANSYKTSLNTAYSLLTSSGVVDVTALSSRYDELAAVENTSDTNWTAESYQTLQDALTAAKAVIDRATAGEALASTDVSNALSNLNSAYTGLTEVTATAAEQTELSTAVTTATGKTESDYTADSWAAYQAAIAAANEVLAKGSAATQNEVKAALAALQEAESALVAAPKTSTDNSTANNSGTSNNTTGSTAVTALKAGETTTQGSITYTVVDAAAKTVSVTSGTDKNAKSVVIPATITANGETYTVTAIANNAFKNYKKLTKVTIGKNVKTIGKNAFSGCKKLKKVTFKGTSVSKVQSKAFKNTNAKIKVKVPKSMSAKKKKALKKKLVKAGMNKKVTVK